MIPKIPLLLTLLLLITFSVSTTLQNMITPSTGLELSGSTLYSYAGGDFNNDGFSDYVYTTFSQNTYVLWGRSQTPTAFPANTQDAQTYFTSINAPHFYSTSGTIFGTCLSSGDINNDGIDDLIISDISSGKGKVYVIFGSASAFPLSTDVDTMPAATGFTITSNSSAASSFFGAAAATGDFNGDKVTDLVLCAPNDVSQSGRCFLFQGPLTSDIDTASATTTITCTGVNCRTIGASGALPVHSGLAMNGDFNGDGYDDIAIGSAYPTTTFGTSFVIYGKPTFPSTIDIGTMPTTNGFHLSGSGSSDGCYKVIFADVNGDGKSDLVTGCQLISKLHITYGRTAIITETTFDTFISANPTGGVNMTYTPLGAPSNMGLSLATADLNHDGKADIISSITYSSGGYIVIYGSNSLYGMDPNILSSSQGYTVFAGSQPYSLGRYLSVAKASSDPQNGAHIISISDYDSASSAHAFVLYGGPCIGGTYNNGACEPCSSGKYNPNGAGGSCLTCPPGHSSKPRSAYCTPCPDGTEPSSDGGSCQACKEGEGANGTGKCTQCPAGTYADGACVPCKKDFSSAPGSTICTQCPAGSETSGPGQGQCIPTSGGALSVAIPVGIVLIAATAGGMFYYNKKR